MPAWSIFHSRNPSNRDENKMIETPACGFSLLSYSLRGIAATVSASLLILSSQQLPARSEPTAFEPLQSTIIGKSDQDAALQAIWDGTLRPKMQTLNAHFETPSGIYILSIKKDRCANTGNVPNLFACPARLALVSSGKAVVLQDFPQFYFSGDLPTSNTAASYIEQSGRNNTRVAIDPEKGNLLVQDTNNGSTGTDTLTFKKP